jgi:SAM-dependent methyltransferase
MLGAARTALAGDPGTAFALLDARGTPGDLPPEAREAAPFALAASNALVQWFPALETHFAFVCGLLAPGGAYLAAGFLRGNFPELNALLAEEPFGHRDFPGHDRSGVEKAAARAGFAVEAWREERMVERYAGAREFLARIQGMGSARRPAEGKPLTRSGLELLVREYQRRYGITEGTGVRATWAPWYALLRKG